MSSENLPLSPELRLSADDKFKHQSLTLLAQQLAEHHHDGYPSLDERLWLPDTDYFMLLPGEEAWNVGQQLPTADEQVVIAGLDVPIDNWGRPLHPWFDEMIGDQEIGLVTGKGFFRRWGPNYTADPVIIQNGYVLLIERADTGMQALPGGFIDYDGQGQPEEPVQAAIRESSEEANIDLSSAKQPKQIYQGPVADPRITANAWTETTAFAFDLGLDPALPAVRAGDDAKRAAWWPIENARRMQLYGSHNLLIELAWQQVCQNRVSEKAYPL